jgi:predicted MFS family arabinose efflux permease
VSPPTPRIPGRPRPWPERLAAHYRSSFEGLSREVWILSIVLFVNRCGTMVVPFLALYLTDEHGFSESAAGEVMATYGVGSMIGVYLGGQLVDRIGYRLVMIGSMLAGGLAFIGFGFLEPGAGLFAGAVAMGCLAESFRPANVTAVAAFATPEQRPRAYALNRLALNLGFSVAPAAAGWLAEVDYGWLFWIDGVTCIVAGLALAVLLPAASRDREVHEAEPEGEATSPFRDGFFLWVLGLLFLQGVVFCQVMGTYPLYLRDQNGFREALVGTVMTANGLLIVAAEMPFIRMIQHRNPLRVMGVGVLFVGLGFGLTPLHPSLAWILFLVVVWTIGEMLVSPMLTTWVANRADKRSRGRYMAAMGMTFALCNIAAPLAGTWTYEHVGPAELWYLCLGICVVAYVGYQVLAARERPPVVRASDTVDA